MPDDDRTTGRQPESEGRPSDAGRRRPYPATPRTSYGYRTTGRRGAVVPPHLLEDRPRRLSEFLMPAAVILAGVLIVVAFGFILSRAVRDDDPQAIPPAQPPALGNLPVSPADQFPIPLPSASDEPSPSPTPSKARTTPPPATSKPPAPPDRGSVKVARGDLPGRVDLSAEGTRDWVHWGQQSTFSLERREDGDFQILEGAPTAPRFRHGFSPQLFSWSGGSPVATSDGTPTGIRTCGKGNGFSISAPAGPATRTLRLYVGALAGRGKLTAKLTTGSAAASATFEERGNNLDTAVFVITYRAPKNGKISLSWITEEAFSQDCGGVALEAATLR
ncbi:hypothetical protein GCM10020358_82190 [Amorphoplanes nipponensis]|uniref:Uncharacterized protein n=1 Tax=Actinoplanes nipponensis TaxID=135950 RepID=A0A919JCN5_9ACTN|nr:hypothetical protein [Actinoplanes nipponensis]GIE48554.1 hypothetical protein Ani05nite_20880 [Actinoplanes nipponensis]